MLSAVCNSQFMELFGDPKTNQKGLPILKIGEFGKVKGGKRLPKGESYADHTTNHPYVRVIDMVKHSVTIPALVYLTQATHEKISRYGVVLEVSADKLGLTEAGIIDVLNVKSDPLLIGSLRGQDGYFPAYHMNKEKWLSIQLGKPELDDAIKDLLSLSYELTAPKKRKPKSSAKTPGDFANGKEKETDEG